MTNHSPDPGIHDGSSEVVDFPTAAEDRGDVLSQILTLIRLRGQLVYSARLSGRWSVGFAPGRCHFHLIESEGLWLVCAGEAPVRLSAGDLVLLPHGRGHRIADDLQASARATDLFDPLHFDASRMVFEQLDGGAITHLVGGVFQFEAGAASLLLSALPTVMRLPASAGGKAPWLAGLTQFLLAEAEDPLPGSSLMISRMIDLVVIRILRSWASVQPFSTGWLGALADERLSRTLTTLHADPIRAWTVGDMAAVAGMSRSTFAERFTQAVGEAPLQYLIGWRMMLAAEGLRTESLSIAQAARRCGYGSEAGFSRAFKAHFGYPPKAARGRRTSPRPA